MAQMVVTILCMERFTNMARPMSAQAQAGYFNFQQSKYLSEGLRADEARMQAAQDLNVKVKKSLYDYQREQAGKSAEPFEKVAEQVQKATGQAELQAYA